MINPFEDIHWNPDREERRKFARSLVLGFPVIALVMEVIGRLSTGHWKPGPLWLGATGFSVGVVLWLIPQIAKPFYLVWYFAACCMGFVMSNLILSVFFWLALTPVALLMRLLGRDPMRRRFDPSAGTYWSEVEKSVDPERYFRQF
jgi:hypothetical protein